MLGNTWKNIADLDFSHISFGSWSMDLQSEKTLNQDFQLPPGTKTVRVENEFGDLEVQSGTGTKVSVTADLKIYGPRRGGPHRGKAEAQEEVQLSGEASGDRFLVKLVKPDGPNRRVQANLTISVPPEIAVELKNSFGKIGVAELKGNLQVENSNGKITIDQVTGDATVNNQYAQVTIGTITGNLNVDAKAGSIEIEQVGKNLTVQNAFGRIKLGTVRGDLQAICKNGQIDVEQALGSAKVENAFGSANLEDCQGPVEADITNGSLKVRISQVTGPSNFDVQFGSIEVSLPESAKFTVDAASSFGQIRTDFPLDPTRSGNTGSTLNGEVNGGGPLLQIRTQNGSINLNED
jgi:DUF4097 and DUF4098 domain-containing protein YvlB